MNTNRMEHWTGNDYFARIKEQFPYSATVREWHLAHEANLWCVTRYGRETHNDHFKMLTRIITGIDGYTFCFRSPCDAFEFKMKWG